MRERLALRGERISEDIGIALLIVGGIAIIGGALLYAIVAELRIWALILIACGAVFILAGAFLGRQQVIRVISTRQGRYSFNTIIMIVAFTVILALVNIVSVAISARVDLTANRSFTLATQTQEVLRNLDQPVEAFGFFTPGDSAAAAAEGLLREYAVRSDNFSYQIVDPETDPAKASRFNLDQNNVVVFASRDRVTQTRQISEQDFTSNLLLATGTQLRTICFLIGHGEHSILSTTDVGMSRAKEAMERELYVVRDFGFASAGKVPEECSVVVVAGPERDLVIEEEGRNDRDLLGNYLGQGGNALILLTNKTPDSWIEMLFIAGISAGGGTIVDPASYAQPDVTTPTIRADGYLPDHPITAPLIDHSEATFFPLVTRVAPLPADLLADSGLTVFPLAFTTDRSWLERNSDSLFNPRFDAKEDLRGPLAIASAVEFPADPRFPEDTAGRIVAIGNSAFATNRFINSVGNLDLLMNSVNWLSEQEGLIGIRARLNVPRILTLTQRQANWILYSGVGVFPALMIVVAGWTWWRRR